MDTYVLGHRAARPDRMSAVHNPLGRLIKLVSSLLRIVVCYQVPRYTCRISSYRVHGYLLPAIRLRRDERPRFLIPRNKLSSPPWLGYSVATPFILTMVRPTEALTIIKKLTYFSKKHISR